jgi:hypothetical protein
MLHAWKSISTTMSLYMYVLPPWSELAFGHGGGGGKRYCYGTVNYMNFFTCALLETLVRIPAWTMREVDRINMEFLGIGKMLSHIIQFGIFEFRQALPKKAKRCYKSAFGLDH